MSRKRHTPTCTCATCKPPFDPTARVQTTHQKVVVDMDDLERKDFCMDCWRDYDAMSQEERSRHGTDGEYIIRTCKGRIQ